MGGGDLSTFALPTNFYYPLTHAICALRAGTLTLCVFRPVVCMNCAAPIIAPTTTPSLPPGQLDVAEEELQRRVKALADAAAALAAAEAAAGKGGTTTSSGSSSSSKKAAAGPRPSIAGGTPQQQQQPPAGSAAAAAAAAGPFVAVHNNMKDWGRRMEAYKALMHEDAADLATKVGDGVVGCNGS